MRNKDYLNITHNKFIDKLDSNIDRSDALNFRLKCRSGYTGNNLGHCEDFVHANYVSIPKKYAFDFLVFCQRNPKACPLLEVTEEGSYQPNIVFNQEIDLRTDIAQYRIYEYGKLTNDHVTDVIKFWKEDLVSFIFGCSYSFDYILTISGVEQRRLKENKYAALYNTNIPCRSSGIFQGNYVCSTRAIKKIDIPKLYEITSKCEFAHGTPLHIGNPEEIGIDIKNPINKCEMDLLEDEEYVFTACGVTVDNIFKKCEEIDLILCVGLEQTLVTDVKTIELYEKHHSGNK